MIGPYGCLGLKLFEPQLPHKSKVPLAVSLLEALSLERLPHGVRETAVVYGSPQGVYEFLAPGVWLSLQKVIECCGTNSYTTSFSYIYVHTLLRLYPLSVCTLNRSCGCTVTYIRTCGHACTKFVHGYVCSKLASSPSLKLSLVFTVHTRAQLSIKSPYY